MYRHRERCVVSGYNVERDGNRRTKPHFQNIYRVALLSLNTHFLKCINVFEKKCYMVSIR